MPTQDLERLYHCVYRLQYHLVLVTKYRRRVLSRKMIASVEAWMRDIIEDRWGGKLIELSGEADHVHVLFSVPPSVELAKAVNALKTATSRRLRKEYSAACSRHYRKPVLWSRSYCLLSTGGAPLETLKEYIKNQGRPR